MEGAFLCMKVLKEHTLNQEELNFFIQSPVLVFISLVIIVRLEH